MTARWRKQPNEKGLARVCQSARGYELREKGEFLIRVAPLYKGWSRECIGWFWYGLGMNTSSSPLPTKEEAKEEADTFYKEYKKNDRS